MGPAEVGYMPVGQRVVPPLGYLVFCRRSPAECGPAEQPQQPKLRLTDKSVTAPSPVTASAVQPAAKAEPATMKSADVTSLSPGTREAAPAKIPVPREPVHPATAQEEKAAPAAIAAAAPRLFALTEARWQELSSVNAQVNDSVRPVRDDVLYQRNEWWSYPTNNAGDCEDYALMKRKMLIERGWPAANLLLTVAKQWNGEGHAVLTVVTDKGELILDNQARHIVGWRDAPYKWVMRQSRTDPNVWVNLDPSRMRTPASRPATVAAAANGAPASGT